MDFKLVKRQIFKAYRNHDDGHNWTWELKDFIQVFSLFYDAYKASIGTDHPRLTTAAIRKVMIALEDYDPDETIELIPQYFKADLNCDYCIAHFVSGDIREFRLFEITY